jgi:hypothetical protein
MEAVLFRRARRRHLFKVEWPSPDHRVRVPAG